MGRELVALNQSLEGRVREAVVQLRAKDQILIAQSRLAAMGEMIGNIAHQWRQPLNALSMVMVNLRDAHDYNELDRERMERYLTQADALIQNMSTTITDFRDFFRPDKERTRFSALEQMQATVELVQASFDNKAIALEIEAPEDLSFRGLPNEFSQVLLNPLGNAKDAILETGRPQGRITLRLEAEDGFGCLRVCDTGGGIPEAIMDRIFEPYFSTREAGTGIGIGLYMSRQVIEQSMNGQLTARNVSGGAEFTVRVPLAGDGP
jgi:signal transduction histidine kinase